MKRATLFTDGGARGNPGPAGIGVLLRDDDGVVLGEMAEGIGVASNNVAEYKALIAGLEMAHEQGITHLDIYLDSQLVVSQMKGEWKIKNVNLRPLAIKAHSLMQRFEQAGISHVRRESNTEADKLANQGMDAAVLDNELDVEAGPAQASLLE
jgi:ribonuclease HI